MNKDAQNIIVWEDSRFEIRIPREPHIDAEDGGHIVIYPKDRQAYTYAFSVEDRNEMIQLEATCEKIMIEHLGADHVNIQRNGNWFFLRHPDAPKGERPHLHVHIYARSKKSRRQPWGEALNFPNPKTGWLSNIHPYSISKIKLIQKKLREVLR